MNIVIPIRHLITQHIFSFEFIWELEKNTQSLHHELHGADDQLQKITSHSRNEWVSERDVEILEIIVFGYSFDCCGFHPQTRVEIISQETFTKFG